MQCRITPTEYSFYQSMRQERSFGFVRKMNTADGDIRGGCLVSRDRANLVSACRVWGIWSQPSSYFSIPYLATLVTKQILPNDLFDRRSGAADPMPDDCGILSQVTSNVDPKNAFASHVSQQEVPGLVSTLSSALGEYDWLHGQPYRNTLRWESPVAWQGSQVVFFEPPVPPLTRRSWVSPEVSPIHTVSVVFRCGILDWKLLEEIDYRIQIMCMCAFLARCSSSFVFSSSCWTRLYSLQWEQNRWELGCTHRVFMVAA